MDFEEVSHARAWRSSADNFQEPKSEKNSLCLALSQPRQTGSLAQNCGVALSSNSKKCCIDAVGVIVGSRLTCVLSFLHDFGIMPSSRYSSGISIGSFVHLLHHVTTSVGSRWNGFDKIGFSFLIMGTISFGIRFGSVLYCFNTCWL